MNKTPDDKTSQKKKKFNIFDSQREGKCVEKSEIKDLNFLNFFRMYGRNATKILNSI